jgi:hypothetical protein
MSLSLTGATVAADEGLFAERIAPVLRQRCVSCHNAAKKRGGLDLSSRDGLRGGSANGPVVVAGDGEKSLIVRVLVGPNARMPKAGNKLSADEVAAVRRWVNAGAKWPDGITLAAATPKGANDWWSLQPLKRPEVPRPTNAHGVRTPIDAFIRAALEANGLPHSPEADRRTLLRRVTFDLHGLPPTPDEIESFVQDPRSDAWERVIDRLLDSPRYGERWGRHWLDVVHYGDTHGYDKDKRRDFGWRYRDYVIRAFNADKPYARFVREQLAGDVLSPGDLDGVTATGFIAAGPWDFVGHVELREGTVDKEKTRLLDRDDMVTTAITTFLSLTIGCARCHDHKFDPISQQDYYRLQAVFAGVERGDRPCPLPPADQAHEQRLADEIDRLREHRADLFEQVRAELLPKPVRSDLAADLARTESRIDTVARERRGLLERAKVFAVRSIHPRPIRVLHRGDVEQPRETVSAGGIGCVAAPGLEFRVANPDEEGSRRAALAEWIAHPANPLTWRSAVNRLWHYHFGRGIVDTPSDFGHNGSQPSHPELLDWLACEFRDGGGSLKKLHRLMLTSAVYRQSSAHNAAAARIDADNRYWWRMNRTRLDAESVRDAVLAVSGKLDLTPGGPGFDLFRFKDDHSPVYDHGALEKIYDPATYRRTIYRFVVRSVPNPLLETLDCADPNINTPVRNTTLTALQALALLNDPFLVRQSEYFAARVEGAGELPSQVDAAYRLALGRPPADDERAAVTAYATRHRLANTCRMLLNLNEFVFVD